MSNPQLNDPTIKWHITAEKITTSGGLTGPNLTIDAYSNIYINSGTGPTGQVNVNNNAWFDSSANLNFSFSNGAYDNVNITTDSSSTLLLTNQQLFQTWPFNPVADKIIRLPLPSNCNTGSWIVINNFSASSTITIKDSTGTQVYAILSPCFPGTQGGSGVKILAVSSTNQTNGGFNFADNWVCYQNSGYNTLTILTNSGIWSPSLASMYSFILVGAGGYGGLPYPTTGQYIYSGGSGGGGGAITWTSFASLGSQYKFDISGNKSTVTYLSNYSSNLTPNQLAYTVYAGLTGGAGYTGGGGTGGGQGTASGTLGYPATTCYGFLGSQGNAWPYGPTGAGFNPLSYGVAGSTGSNNPYGGGAIYPNNPGPSAFIIKQL